MNLPAFNHTREDSPRTPCPICKAIMDGQTTDAEKILLKVVDLQAKYIDNSLSMFLYSIDTKELFQEQRRAFLESCVKADLTSKDEIALLMKGYKLGQSDVWHAICTIAETQGER